MQKEYYLLMHFVVFRTSQSSIDSDLESNGHISSNIPKFETILLDLINSS